MKIEEIEKLWNTCDHELWNMGYFQEGACFITEREGEFLRSAYYFMPKLVAVAKVAKVLKNRYYQGPPSWATCELTDLADVLKELEKE